MPTLFPAPPKKQLSYLHFSHVSFAVSDGQKVILIDPFFSGEFQWNNRTERHLQLPQIKPADIKPVDGVFISHEHGDHWDPKTLKTLLAKKPGVLCAPKITLDDMKKAGVDTSGFTEARKLMSFDIGKMKVTLYPSIEADNLPEPVQRVGFLVEAFGSVLYHQGDSHGPAKTWGAFKDRLDAIIIWPEYVRQYCSALHPRSVILHHMDKFDPGDFFCNLDPKREQEFWSYRYRQTTWVVPQRNVWYDVKTHKASK